MVSPTHRMLLLFALALGCASVEPARRGHRLPPSSKSEVEESAPAEERPALDRSSAEATAEGEAEREIAPLGGGLVSTGATPHRMILFTFDDGPHPEHTPAVLDALDAYGARAVFFVVPGRIARGGVRAAEEAELVRATRARGHVVGSHGLNHVHLHRLAREELEAEVVLAEATLLEVLGERPWLFRPPGGARSSASDALLAERGYTQMLWNVVTGDFLTTDPEVVLSTFRRSLRGRERRGMPGGIVLLHDTHPWTVRALPAMLAYLEDRNCELLARGEELYDWSPDPRWFIAPRAEGDAPEREAPPLSPPAEAFAARQAELVARARAHCADGS